METAYVATKGQLVIPVRIRRRHGIKPGTRINFIEEPNGRIVLQPVTREFIRSVRGMFKLKPGEKPVTQELMEEHAEEVRREEEKLEKHRSR